MVNAGEKPNLLVTASTFPCSLADTEPRFIFDLCRQLKRTFNIIILTPLTPGAKQYEIMDEVRVIRYRYAPFRNMETLTYPGAIVARIKEKPFRALLVPLMFFGLYRAVRKVVKSERIDLVHAHWLIPQGIIQGLLKGKKYPPYILTCHGGDVFSLNGFPIKQLKQRAINRSQAVTVVSQFLKDALMEHYSVNKALSVIPMGCYTQKFDRSLYSGEYFQRLGILRPVVLFVGRLAEKKGVEYLIKSLTHEVLSKKEFTVAIVGEGSLRKPLEKLAVELKVDDKIVFLGGKTHEQLYEIYSSADILCAPSVTAEDGDREAFGVVTIEAASSGLPVITTKRGDDESVINGKTAFVVEEKNPEQIALALSKLLESDELRSEFGRAGREYAKQFDWEIIGQRYSDFLLDVLQRIEK